MGENIYFLVLVISSLSSYYEVQAQKSNFCNVTESYFVEVNKTETVLTPKKSGGFKLLSVFQGNKYENVTKFTFGVEKRERIVEDCCKGYKKKDNLCVPIDDTRSTQELSSSTTTSTTTTTTTTTTATPSLTSTTTATNSNERAPEPSSSPVTEPATPTVTSGAVSTESSSASVITSESSSTTIPSNSATDSTYESEGAPLASSESPVTTTSVSTEPKSEPSPSPGLASPSEPPSSTSSESSSASPTTEPTSSSEVTPAIPNETSAIASSPKVSTVENSASTTEPAVVPEPQPITEAPPPIINELSATVPSTEIPTETSASVTSLPAPLQTENTSQNEAMVSSLVVTTNTAPITDKPITTPLSISYFNSELPVSSSPSTEPTTTSKQVVISTDDAIKMDIDSTTVVSSRRRRSLDTVFDSADTTDILNFESNTLPEDVNEVSKSIPKQNHFKLNENLVSLKNHHHHLHQHSSDSDDIVVNDLIADNEDQSYPWIEVFEVLSFGAVVFLLVITVQTSFHSETFTRWKGNKKISQEIDNYGEFWVYDSRGNLEEV